MDRRNAIKSIGGVLISSSIVGSAQGSSSSHTSLASYEKYCRNLSKKFGPRVDGRIAAQNSDGDNLNPDGISLSIENSEVKKAVKKRSVKTAGEPDETIYTKEILEFSDGTEVEQYVVINDENEVVILVNGEKFTIDRSELIRTLQQRFRQAERNEKKKFSKDTAKAANGDTNSKTITGEISSAGSYTHDDLANYEVGSLRTPVTGSAEVDPNWTNDTTDRLELAALSALPSYANAQIAAWDTWDLSGGSHDITVEFNGEFSAAAANALGLSKIELECFIAYDNENKVETSNAVHKNGFVADYWSDSGDWNVGIYESNFDYDQVLVGLHATAKAGGVKYSAATADALSGGDFLSYDGYFNLDHYTLDIE